MSVLNHICLRNILKWWDSCLTDVLGKVNNPLKEEKKNIGEWNLAGSVFGWGSKPNCSWDKAEKLHVSIVTRKNRTGVVYIKVFPASVPVCAKTAGGGGELDNEVKQFLGNVNNIQWGCRGLRSHRLQGWRLTREKAASRDRLHSWHGAKPDAKCVWNVLSWT